MLAKSDKKGNRVDTAHIVEELVKLLDGSNTTTESVDSTDIVIKAESLDLITEALAKIPPRSTVIIEISEENISMEEVVRHMLDNPISSNFELIIREKL